MFVVSPMTAKLRRSLEPTVPTTAVPVSAPPGRAASRVLGAKAASRRDDRERGRGGAAGMVRHLAGCVAAAHHAVPGELLDDPTRRIDQRDDVGPVAVEHRDHFGR